MKKRLLIILLALCLCVTGTMLAACGGGNGGGNDGGGNGGGTPVTYTVTFVDANGNTLATKTINGGTAVNAEGVPTEDRAGYAVTWVDANGNAFDFSAAINADTTVKIAYVAKTDTAYKVEHYTEKLSGGYELADTENLTGTTDTEATATAKTIEGFVQETDNANAVLSAEIKGDGSTVLKVYYERKSYNISFAAYGEELDSATVKHGATVTATDESVPAKKTATTMDVFKHWSLSEGGDAYDFSTAVTGAVTLYAVYDTVDRQFTLTLDTNGDLYYLATEEGEWYADLEYDYSAFKSGDTFKFAIDYDTEADTESAPTVTVVYMNDDGTESDPVTLTPENGIYTVSVTSDAKLTVSGIKAIEYSVALTYVEPTYIYDWARPYESSEDIIVMVTPEGGETYSVVNAVDTELKTIALDVAKGRYTVCAFVMDKNENLKAISGETTFEINKDLYAENNGELDTDLVLNEPFFAPAGKIGNDTFLGDNIVWNAEAEKYEVEEGQSFMAELKSFNPGDDDFAVTVAFDQIIDDEHNVSVDSSEIFPTVGAVFMSGDYDKTANLAVFDAGTGRLSTDKNWSGRSDTVDIPNSPNNSKVGFRTLAAAGAILGRIDFPDCFRHAVFTYVKHDGILYAYFSGNGDAGYYAGGKTWTPSSTKRVENKLMFAIDIAAGTAYFNQDNKTGEFSTYTDAKFTEYLSNITSMGMIVGHSKVCHVQISNFGYTYDAEVITGFANMAKNTVKATLPDGVTATVNGVELGAEAITVAPGAKTVEINLPEGKILSSLTINGEEVNYDIVDGKPVYVIAESFDAAFAAELVATLADGKYTDQTVVSGAMSKHDGSDVDYSRVVIRFTAADGTAYDAQIDKAAGTYSVTLPIGKYTVVATNDTLMDTKFVDFTAGLAESSTKDVVFDGVNVHRFVSLSGVDGLHMTEDGSLIRTNTNRLAQEAAINGVTFVPNDQILEFGYTLTGMNMGGTLYPLYGLIIKDIDGNIMRAVCKDAGDVLGFLLRDSKTSTDDHLSICTWVEPGGDATKPWFSFGGYFSCYSWNPNTVQVQNGTYALTLKFRVDGHNLSIWVKTPNTKGEWKLALNNVNVRDYYANGVACKRGTGKDYVDNIYALDQPCQFGVTARINIDANMDYTKNNGKFNDIWYNIIERE